MQCLTKHSAVQLAHRPACLPAKGIRPSTRRLPRLHAVQPVETDAAAPAPRTMPSGNMADSVIDQKICGPEPEYVPVLEPTDDVLRLWRTADAVCFDVDCTITVNDGLDLLAEFMGVGNEVAELTDKAMDGTMNLAQSLEARLELLKCTPDDVRRFLKAHPPQSRLAPGIEKLIKALQARNVAVYLISGGFREIILPIAKHLKIPKEHVFANRMNWQWDDETGLPSRLAGFDTSQPTSQNKGKVAAIAQIRQENPWENIVMIGDGITDLEAVQESNGADLFIGYGGIVERPSVASVAEWFVRDYDVLVRALKRYKVCIVGSDAWACATAHMVAQNCYGEDDRKDDFDDYIRMWVPEEDYQGRKLTEVINEIKEHPRSLPGVPLGENVSVSSDLLAVVQDADIIIFCAPHQQMHAICKSLMGKVKREAIAINLTKPGMRLPQDGPQLISQMVKRYLNIDCSVLMGANIASDIGKEELSEAVIGYHHRANGEVLQKLFQRRYFNITLVPDPVGAEICGTLKNVVALGAGMIDGLKYGPNSKAAILREGLSEMRKLAKAMYPAVRDETFFESCGVADLISTCYGGRNRAVSAAWAAAWKEGKPVSWEQLEREMLDGHPLQGRQTSDEVQQYLRKRGWEAEYPLFTTINMIANGHQPPTMLFKYQEVHKLLPQMPAVEEEFAVEPRLPKAMRTVDMS